MLTATLVLFQTAIGPWKFDTRTAFILAGALFALFCDVYAQASTALAEASKSRVRPFILDRAEQWTLRSKAGRTFEISVSLPKGSAPASGYPVIYVLDANTAFATLADAVRTNEPLFGPVVVVGVGYPNDVEISNRSFDLSPRVDPATLPAYLPNGWGAIGGAGAFFSFLQEDLKPAIEKSVPVDKRRQALFGHSMGGLFVLHVLFTHPDAFDTYIAGSPSCWWGNGAVLKELPAFQQQQSKSNVRRRLLITVGELEAGMTEEEIRAAAAMKLIDPEKMIRNANMVSNVESLASKLEFLSTYGLQVVFVKFPNETHSSVIPAYLGRGMRFALGGWFN